MKQNNDIQAALDALNEIIDDLKCASITGELTQNQKSEIETIRAALTAQQSDVNQELLEALKEARCVLSSLNYKGTTPFRRNGVTFYGQTDEWCEWVNSEILPVVRKAISKAEKQGA